jgi:hypothetical protein
MIKDIKLNYDFDIFLTANYGEAVSCIKHQVHELTDIHTQYGGFPDTYTFHNTKIHQVWWDDTQIDYVNIGQQLGIDVITVSSILQPPGCVIPLHRDTFYQINQRHPTRADLKVRANIYLEDWRLGHFVQYNNQVDTHWKQGQGWLWDSSELHLGANAGMQNKYTLQVSGFLIEPVPD